MRMSLGGSAARTARASAVEVMAEKNVRRCIDVIHWKSTGRGARAKECREYMSRPAGGDPAGCRPGAEGPRRPAHTPRLSGRALIGPFSNPAGVPPQALGAARAAWRTVSPDSTPDSTAGEPPGPVIGPFVDSGQDGANVGHRALARAKPAVCDDRSVKQHSAVHDLVFTTFDCRRGGL